MRPSNLDAERSVVRDGRPTVRPHDRHNAGGDECHENGELGDGERRLRLSGSEVVQCRHFHERLDDEDEHVEVEREQRGDDVHAFPDAGQSRPIDTVVLL